MSEPIDLTELRRAIKALDANALEMSKAMRSRLSEAHYASPDTLVTWDRDPATNCRFASFEGVRIDAERDEGEGLVVHGVSGFERFAWSDEAPVRR